MQVNRANFLTWYSSEVEASRQLPTHTQSVCDYGMVLWEIGDTMSFIVNTEEGISVGATPTIDVLNAGGSTVLASFSVLSYTSDLITGSKLYATITCPTLPIGFYDLRINNSSITYKSQPVFICTTVFAESSTVKFKFRHRFDKNNVGYANGLPDTFYQEFRLLATFTQNEAQVEKDIIIDMDSPTPREYNHKVQYSKRGVLYNLDSNMHQASVDLLSSSELFVNNRRYQSQGDYTSGSIRKDGKSNGEFTMSDYALRYLKRS
jgi:hypothetical protein